MRLPGLGIIAIIVIIAGAASLWFWARVFQTEKPAPSDQTPEEQEIAVIEGKGALPFMPIPFDSPQVCTFEETAQEERTTGTAYIVPSQQTRIDYETVSLGQEELVRAGHIIVTQDALYAWFDGEESGTKLSLAEGIPEEVFFIEHMPLVIRQKEQGGFPCSSWSVDKTRFEVPKDILFTDFPQV